MQIRGVNLGGWLVLEKWITPSVFEGVDVGDELSFCASIGKKQSRKILDKHRRSFITPKDFDWLAKKGGINTVRIPVGYWIFGGFDPFIGAADYLDFCMAEAEKRGLKVLIDLHGAPGSQNGWDHSGASGIKSWDKDNKNISLTLNVLEDLAKRYGNRKSLFGIELLNEPRWDIPLYILEDFYIRGYETVRKHCRKEVAIVFSDGFRPQAWRQFFTEKNFENIYLDCHLYQCFDKADIELDIYGHLAKTVGEWRNFIEEASGYVPVLVGEWSAALDNFSLRGLDENYREVAFKSYVLAQIMTFKRASGWFYWTYKTEDETSVWSFRQNVLKNYLP